MNERDIAPDQFLDWYQSSEDKEQVIDIRERSEWEYYHLDGTTHIPMNTIPAKTEEIPKDRKVYIICAHGSRSAMVCDYLRNQGFDNLINVLGGMAAVSELRGFEYD